MQTFEANITTEWQEVLQGSDNLFFDALAVKPLYVFFSESDVPSAEDEGQPLGCMAEQLGL